MAGIEIATGELTAGGQPEGRTQKAAYYFCSQIVEDMAENALVDSDRNGWPNCTVDQMDELDEKVKDVINAWATKHGLHPTFATKSNVGCY